MGISDPLMDTCGNMQNDFHIILYDGVSEKVSNGGTQYYQQDRVYSSQGFAMCHPANIPGGSYKYLVIVDAD